MEQKNNKKRKLSPSGRDIKNEWQQDQKDYYRRLLFSAQKALRKESKAVQKFECQRLIRKIKERKFSKDGKSTTSATSNITVKGACPVVEETYYQLKRLDVELVVNESLRRLGILSLDPLLAQHGKAEQGNDESAEESKGGKLADSDGATPDSMRPIVPVEADKGNVCCKSAKGISETCSSDTNNDGKCIAVSLELQQSLVERILKHKKLQAALENWNEQVTEYRRWCLRRQNRESHPPPGNATKMQTQTALTKKIKKQKKGRAQLDESGGRAMNALPQKSLFLKLGHESLVGAGDSADCEDLHYGPGSFSDEKKKNRKGQRARRAKAMAIEAKLAGRLHRPEESLNWRPKAKSTDEIEEPGDKQNLRPTACPRRSREMFEKPDSKEALHPSWAAAKKNKESGIVEFKGSKITF